MTWQMRLPGVWVFGEEVRGAVRESLAEVGAVPGQFGGAEWAWAVSVKAAGESKDDAVGPLSGREKRFGDALGRAEAALRRMGVEP